MSSQHRLEAFAATADALTVASCSSSSRRSGPRRAVSMPTSCRIWWPHALLSSPPSSSAAGDGPRLLLVGWMFASSSAQGAACSVDVVVAAACNPVDARRVLLENAQVLGEYVHQERSQSPPEGMSCQDFWLLLGPIASNQAKSTQYPGFRALVLHGTACSAVAQFVMYKDLKAGEGHTLSDSSSVDVIKRGSGKWPLARPAWLRVLEQKKGNEESEDPSQQMVDVLSILSMCKEIRASVSSSGRQSSHSLSSAQQQRLSALSNMGRIQSANIQNLVRCSIQPLEAVHTILPFRLKVIRNIVQKCQDLIIWEGKWPAVLVDVFLGLWVAFATICWQNTVALYLTKISGFIKQILLKGCDWLLQYPVGLKLNTELARFYGWISIISIQSWSHILSLTSLHLPLLLTISALLSMPMGLSTALSLIADALTISASPIILLYNFHHVIFTHHTNLLTSLWRMFRGVKRNPLRKRVDSFECSIEQLIVASLFFTSLLLLLPTTLAYVVFYSILFIAIRCLQIFLRLSEISLTCFPYQELIQRFLEPKSFPSGISFKPVKPCKLLAASSL